MHLFYTSNISGDAAILTQEESHHCVKVLRLGKGDEVNLIDGTGGFYDGVIEEPNAKACRVKIISCKKEYGKRPFKLTIGFAPTKNIDRTEWAIEKCTEMGIDEFSPLVCRYSERKELKLERLEKVVMSAVKQSLKAYIPHISELDSFKNFVESSTAKHKYIAYCGACDKIRIETEYTPCEDAVILIGPEGDFSQSEVEEAQKHGFIPVSLGDSRLRTETAIIVACHTLNFLNKI